MSSAVVLESPAANEVEAQRQPKTRRRLLLKLDVLLMSITTIAFGLQYYDKAILGSASLFGIIPDLGLSTPLPGGKTSLVRYSTANSAFYWGYLCAAFPLSLLVQRARLNWFLGGAIVLWGFIAILTPVVANYKGLVAQRFFLGAVESAVSPGFILITRMWYLKEETPVRLGICSATGLFSIVSGLINYGIGKAASKPSSPISHWKAMYFFAGALTILFGVVVFFILPPSPQRDAILNLRFNRFSLSEKAELAQRTRADRNVAASAAAHRHAQDADHADEKATIEDSTSSASIAGAHQRAFSRAQALEALSDYKIWIYFLQAIALYITNGGVTAFGAIIIRGFGYTPLRSIILQTPAGASTAHLAGFYLLASFGAPFVLVLSSATANVRGSTKQSLTSGAIFVGYNISNIFAPYLVKAPQAAAHYPDIFIPSNIKL
ncbi:hypothetical protein V8E36_009621 [Tilletia maclaganii]